MKTQLFTFVAASALLAACDGGDSTWVNPGVGGGSTGNPVMVLTVSGALVDLADLLFTTDCYTEDGDDIRQTLEFSGGQMTQLTTTYGSSNASCSGSTAESSFTATATSGSAYTIDGWVDGMDNATTAPDAHDGSGPLADDEEVTLIGVTIVTSTSGNPPVGVSGNVFYVVDDTDSAGCLVLYRDSDETSASTVDPMFGENC